MKVIESNIHPKVGNYLLSWEQFHHRIGEGNGKGGWLYQTR